MVGTPAAWGPHTCLQPQKITIKYCDHLIKHISTLSSNFKADNTATRFNIISKLRGCLCLDLKLWSSLSLQSWTSHSTKFYGRSRWAWHFARGIEQSTEGGGQTWEVPAFLGGGEEGGRRWNAGWFPLSIICVMLMCAQAWGGGPVRQEVPDLEDPSPWDKDQKKHFLWRLGGEIQERQRQS